MRFVQKALAIFFILFITLMFFSSINFTAKSIEATLKDNEISALAKGMEFKFNESFPYKDFFVDINGLFHKLLLQRVMNDVVALDNDHCSELMEDKSDEVITQNAQKLKEFQTHVYKTGAKFLYVQIPFKNSKYEDRLPEGLDDYSNIVADKFLMELKKLNVNYIDFRSVMHNENIDQYKLYLKTEHHWSPEGGFYAFQKLCEYFVGHYGEKIDAEATDINNYNRRIYKQSSLGYYGQRTGRFFTGLDDFTLIYPKFATKQDCSIVHKNIYRKGSFYDAIFDMKFLQKDKRQRGMYHIYIGGDFPLVIHKSDTAKNEKTVLLFIDSFGVVVEPFLTTVFKNVIAVDLRWVQLNKFNKTAEDFVDEYHPNIVVLMLNPSQITIDANCGQFNMIGGDMPIANEI